MNLSKFQARYTLGASTVALVASLAIGSAAHAQDGGAPTTPAGGPAASQEIIVTGFRASLNSALAMKRREIAAIDSIKAEDIGKFPDSNLAESMQRVPGVALARGDAGEGRSVSVRGLGPAFTRVRINGMEGSSQTGGSDVYVGNGGRQFDFGVFPTEIFNSLAVRKTPSADIEEGSLGATVDIAAPKPLEQSKDFVFSATVKVLHNEVANDLSPRGSLLVAKKFGDGRWGVLGSLAYQKRDTREVGYSAVDILSANTNGLFCSPVGFNPVNPGIGVKGADANNCYPGLPRTSSLAAYNTVYNARRADLPNVPGSGAFFPRIPRYVNSTQKQRRIGGSFTLQFQPDGATDISVDILYSRLHVTRQDNYIAGLSFARSIANNGQPMVSIKDITLSSLGSVQNASYDGVDIRSEGNIDNYISTFKQASLNFRHDFSDKLRVTALFGMNDSNLNNYQRFQSFMDIIDKPFTFAYNGASTPTLGFGVDVSNPNNFSYAPGLADGTVTGGFNLQGTPRIQSTKGLTANLNFDWTAKEGLHIKAGGQFRRSDYSTLATGFYTADTLTKALPAGVSLASLTYQISGLDKLWGHGAPASWAAIDPAKLISTFGLDQARRCGIECGVGPSRLLEEETSGYLMSTFDMGSSLPFGVRGDIGVRFIHTGQASSAYNAAPLASSPTGVTGVFTPAGRSYDNWLPSANLVIEPMKELLFRFSAAKAMSRPELAQLTPSSSVNAITRTATVQNANLEPIKATTFDVAAEWYFRRGSLLSVAFFHKNIGTFVQSVSQIVPYNTLGLPDALLTGSNTQPTELFTVTQPLNTPGGKLNGVEFNLQLPFTFLSSPFLKNFGLLANYTRVNSKINYITATSNGVVTARSTASLIGLSPNTASATVYFENDKLSIRGTVNYRDKFLRQVPASPGSDVIGNDATTFVDASISYNLSRNIKLTIEGQNLTGEQNRLYIDSARNDTYFQTRIDRTFMFGVNFQM